MLEDLRSLAILRDLPSATLERLETYFFPVSFNGGEVLMFEGDEDAPVVFLVEGTVRVYRTNYEGREQTLIYLRAGDVFNLPAAFTVDSRSPASVQAVDQVRALKISRRDLRQAVRESPQLALAVLEDLSEKLYHLTDLVHDVSLRTVRGRLAKFLLAQAQGGGDVQWTHEQIAMQLGTRREVVSRALRAFLVEGLIQTDRQRILVLDPQKLENEIES